jgi:hypothetical protein
MTNDSTRGGGRRDISRGWITTTFSDRVMNQVKILT